MNKEQIQQKFNEILKGLGFEFWTDGQLKNTQRLIKKDFEELMALCFNFGLEVAADNADANFNIIDEDDEANFERLTEGIDYEVYCLKESILKFKL